MNPASSAPPLSAPWSYPPHYQGIVNRSWSDHSLERTTVCEKRNLCMETQTIL